MIGMVQLLRVMSASLFGALLMVGCLTPLSFGDVDDHSAERPLPVWREGSLHMDVPVPVITVGFDEDATRGLKERLKDAEEVSHHTTDGPIGWTFEPTPDDLLENPEPVEMRSPIVPTGRFEVTTVPETVEQQIMIEADDWIVSGNIREGRGLEALVAEAADEGTLDLDPNLPGIILFNSSPFMEDHGWRYSMPNGYLEPVEIFGGREPFVILDTALLGHDPSTPAGLAQLAGLVRALTHYRVLQGPVTLMPLAQCHALTLVTAHTPTSQTQWNPMMKSALELLDPDQIARAFRNLTGTEVHVDTLNLTLPADDPVLATLARGEFWTEQMQRAWLAENWDRYWVEHEGCEGYVSFLIHTDAASLGIGGGFGYYDHGRGFRVAVSWVNELMRFTEDPVSPAYMGKEGMSEFNQVDYLHAHETGHIFGMRHPHDIRLADGSESRFDFEDVWSTMSYAGDGRVIDFGMIEQTSFQRNRMGFLFHAAHALGLEDEATYQDALNSAADHRWSDANELLWDMMETKVTRVGGSLRPESDSLSL